MTACAPADGRDVAGLLHGADLRGGDVGRELDHLDGFAVAVEDWVVGRLDPDFLAAFADALVFRSLVFAPIERGQKSR